jgi:hypothetical protein
MILDPAKSGSRPPQHPPAAESSPEDIIDTTQLPIRFG